MIFLTQNVMGLIVQVDVVQKPTISAVNQDISALPPKPIALPFKKLLKMIVRVQYVLVDVVPTLDGSAVLEMNIALLVKNTARKTTLLRN